MSDGPVKPITPHEARRVANESLPPEVIEAFNELLTERAAAPLIIIHQHEVLDRILEKMNHGIAVKITPAMIFERHWLDVEGAYRGAGWLVEYDKPGYNETFEAHWTFQHWTFQPLNPRGPR